MDDPEKSRRVAEARIGRLLPKGWRLSDVEPTPRGHWRIVIENVADPRNTQEWAEGGLEDAIQAVVESLAKQRAKQDRTN
jgi:hypothetical protein